MPNRREIDHIGDFMFTVEIEGVTVGSFFECDGIESETEVIGVDDGTEKGGWDVKRPGRHSYGNITLKRGYVNTDELWIWRKAVIEGMVERKAGSIVLREDNGEEVMRYNFFEAWPTKWKGMNMNAAEDGVEVEEIEFAIEKLERG